MKKSLGLVIILFFMGGRAHGGEDVGIISSPSLEKETKSELKKDQQAELVSEIKPNNNNKPRKITASLLIDTSSTLSTQSESSAGEGYSASGLYRFDLGVPLSRTFTATLRTGYSSEYSYVLPDGSSGDFIDSQLGLVKAWGIIAKDLSLSAGTNLTLPTSNESRREGLQSAATLYLKGEQKLKKFSIILIPAFTEFFFDTYVQLDGTPNNESSLGMLAEIDYSLTDKFTLSASVWPTRSWTYYGTSHDKYFIDYEISYEASKHVVASLGIYNKASALKSNGLDYNYALYDQSQYMGYIDLILKL